MAAPTWTIIRSDDLSSPTDPNSLLNGSVSMSGDNLQIPVSTSTDTSDMTDSLYWTVDMPSGVIPASGGEPAGAVHFDITVDSWADPWGITVGIADTSTSTAAGLGFYQSSGTLYTVYAHSWNTDGTAGTITISQNRTLRCEAKVVGGDGGTTGSVHLAVSGSSYTATGNTDHYGASEDTGSLDIDNVKLLIMILHVGTSTDTDTLSARVAYSVVSSPT